MEPGFGTRMLPASLECAGVQSESGFGETVLDGVCVLAFGEEAPDGARVLTASLPCAGTESEPAFGD